MTPTKPHPINSMELVSMRDQISADVDRFLALGGRIDQRPGFAFNEIPLRNSKRYPLPEWEAARKRRDKQKSKTSGADATYTQLEVMAFYGCVKSTDGYRKFDRLIAAGKVPPHDSSKDMGRGRMTRYWLREKLDPVLIALRAAGEIA